MFGRGRKQREAARVAEEAERRALFEQLARRPETVCPFLGLADERAGYRPKADDAHRCYAFGDPAELTSDQQTRVCLERGYGNCPRYLRGVLVIPTEEIEALRRPAPPPEPAGAPAPPPPPRRRRGLLVPLAVAGVLVAGAAVGGAAMLLSGRLDVVAQPTPTPIMTTQPPASPPGPTPTATPPTTPTPTVATQTPIPTPTPEPTPEPVDVFTHYEVSVAPGNYTLYRVAADGTFLGSQVAAFENYSRAQIEPRVSGDVVHWITVEGDYTGLSYVWPDSGPFRVRAVFIGPAGERRSYLLDEEDAADFPEGTPAPQPID